MLKQRIDGYYKMVAAFKCNDLVQSHPDKYIAMSFSKFNENEKKKFYINNAIIIIHYGMYEK